MFHCLVIKVVLLSALCDSLFRLSHLEELVKNFFQKFFEVFSKGFRRRHFSYLFKRLDYFTISSVDCQQLIWIFWKLFYFSVFQKQFLATACLYYHCRKEKSSTFYKKLQISALSKKTRHNAYGKYEKNIPKNRYLIPYKIHINRLSLKA